MHNATAPVKIGLTVHCGAPTPRPETHGKIMLRLRPPLLALLALPQCHPTTTTPSSTRAAANNVSIFAIYGSGADPATLRAAGINTILGGAPKLADGYNFTSIKDDHARLGMATFVDVSFIWHGRSGLAPGWQAGLAELVQSAAASGVLSSGAVTGLFLGDEICCDGVPVANLSAAASFAKAQLRKVGHGEALVYVNECKNAFIGKSCEYPATQDNCTPVTCWHCGGREYPGWIKGKLPEGLDLISLDSSAPLPPATSPSGLPSLLCARRAQVRAHQYFAREQDHRAQLCGPSLVAG